MSLTTIEEINSKQKPNPNNYPIVDKWNYKYVIKPNMNKIYKECKEVLDTELPKIYEEQVNDFASNI